MVTKHLGAVSFQVVHDQPFPRQNYLQNEQIPRQHHFSALSYPLDPIAHPAVPSVDSGDFQSAADPPHGDAQNSAAVAGMAGMTGMTGMTGMAGMAGMTSLNAINPIGSEAFCDLQSLAPNTGQAQYGLYKYLHSGAPWNPVGPTTEAGTASREPRDSARPYNFMTSHAMPTTFVDFRDAAARSECDTLGAGLLLSEPDYASMPRRSGAQSMGHTFSASSICELDNSAETKSLAGNLSAINLQPGFQRVDVAFSDDLYCSHCKFSVKTKSELKKHRQKHEKPHTCDINGCRRNNKGFSTLNDLQRHKASVHKQFSGTKSRVYRCHLGSCANLEKNWPRADNFRSHLKRMHRLDPDMDLQRYVFQPSDPCYLTTPEPSNDGDPGPPPAPHEPAAAPQSTWASSELGDSQNVVSASSFASASALGRNGNMAALTPSPCFDGSSVMSVVTSAREARIQAPDLDLDLDPSAELQSLSEGSLAYDGVAMADPQTMPVHVPADFKDFSMLDQQSFSPDLLSHAGMDASFAPAFNHFNQTPQAADELVLEDHPASIDTKVDDEQQRQQQQQQQRSINALQSDENLSQVSSQSSSSEDDHSPRDRDASIRTASSTSPSFGEEKEKKKVYDETQARDIIETLMEQGILDKVMSNLGMNLQQKSSATFSGTPSGDTSLDKAPGDADCPHSAQTTGTQSAVAGEKTKDRFPCDKCTKTFLRMCELRKHAKRHEKPYRCQYPECESRFGSKNDRKRHENSLHLHQEFIVCRVKPSQCTGGRCNMVMFRQESFNRHVQNVHRIDEPEKAERSLVRGRSGPDNKVEYTCSSCSQTIQVMKSAAASPSTDRRQIYVVDHLCAPVHATTPQRGGRISSATVPARDSDPEQHKRSASGTHKRPRDSDREGTSLGQIRVQGKLIWYCCRCQEHSSVDLNPLCVDCSHYRCGGCRLEETPPERQSDCEPSIEPREKRRHIV